MLGRFLFLLSPHKNLDAISRLFSRDFFASGPKFVLLTFFSIIQQTLGLWKTLPKHNNKTQRMFISNIFLTKVTCYADIIKATQALMS